MKKILTILVILAGVLVVMTGLPLKIGHLEVGILRPVIVVRDLKLGNPASFSDPVMVNLHELYVDYDLGALIQKREVRVLSEATVKL